MPEDRRFTAIMFNEIVEHTALFGADEDQIYWILLAIKKHENPFVKY